MLGDLVMGVASLNMWMLLLLALPVVLFRKARKAQSYPFVDCQRCERGRVYDPRDPTRWRDCPSCGGYGYWLATGARDPKVSKTRYAVRNRAESLDRTSRRTARI